MRALSRTRRRHLAWPHVRALRPVVVGLVAAVLALSWSALSPASAGDPRIERAQEEHRQAQRELDGVLARLGEAQARVEAAEAESARLQAAENAYRESAADATAAVARFAQAAYRHGATDPALALLASGSPGEALDQARLLSFVTHRSQAGYEAANAARVRTQVAADAAAEAAESLRARRTELDQVRREVGETVAAAERKERAARATVAAERAAQAAREAPSRQAAAPRAARSSSAVASAPVAGDVACPVGQPRSYSDTYGAPRSGGRAHKGTDVIAPRGTPIYAYESGTVSRLNSSGLGGISLYLRGSSGASYYYTHLQGYVAGVSAGQRVEAGQHIAFNGDTGNARGIPHLHFEVMPGGGGNVNPYPYVRRACG